MMFKRKAINTKQSTFTPKTKKRSIWNILLVSGISAASLGGAATAIYFSTTNYIANSQYGVSYRATTSTNDLNDTTQKTDWFENPCLSKDPITTSDWKTKIPNDIKNAYSRYLVDNKIDDFDVDCSYTNNKINLSATLPYQKYVDSTDDSKKKDQAPNNIYLDNMTSSRISLVYAYYGDYSGGTQYSSIITPEEYLNDSQQIKLSDDSKNVYVHIDGKIGKQISDSLKIDNKDATSKPKSEIYIIKDVNGLINRMANDIQVTFYYHNMGSCVFFNNDHRDELYNAYHGMSSDDQSFGEAIYTKYTDVTEPLETYSDSNGTLGNFLNNSDIPTKSLDGLQGYFYRFIDGDLDKADGGSRGTITESYKKLMNKYVMGIIKPDDDNKSLWTYLPTKDPTSKDKKKDSNNEWLVLGDNDLSKASTIYKSYKIFAFSLPEKNLMRGETFSTDSNALRDINDWSEAGVFGQIMNQTKQKFPSFNKSWFKTSPLISSIIALVLIIMLIGVVISVLYRIPWLLAVVCVITTLALSLLIMILGGYAISLGLLMGLFVVFICSTFTICLFMERWRKQFKEGLTPLVGWKKVIKNTILQGIDIHVVNLLIAVCFIFMGSLDLNTMGICMAIGTLLSAVLVLCLWPFMCWLLYLKNFRKINLLMMLNKNQTVNIEQQTSLQSSFSNNNWKIKFNIFNNLAKIIVGLIILLIIVVGCVLLATNANHIINNLFVNKAIGDYFLTSLYAWLISIGLISLYGLIRLNWTTFIPLLIVLVLGLSIPFMLVVIFQLPIGNISSNYVITMAMGYAVNTSLAIVLANNLNNAWIRTHLLTKKGLIEVLNLELKNNLIFVIEIMGICFGSLFILLIVSSTSLILVYLITMIFVMLNVVLMYSVLPWMLFYFIQWRYQYIGGTQRKLDGSYDKRNYDDIDEQEINQINKFKKVKATA